MKKSQFSKMDCPFLLSSSLILTLSLLFISSTNGQENLALNKPVTASKALLSNPASHAVDGNDNTHWGAGDWPVQWISIDLQATYNVNLITLRASQSPAANTVHKIFFSTDGSNWQLVATLSGYTYDGIELYQPFSSLPTRYVKVETAESPSWVSWFEIRVFDDAVLPVELTSFYGTTIYKNSGEGKIGNNLILWSTSSEKNSLGFQLERLNNDLKEWEKLVFLSSNGDDSIYKYLDGSPHQINYYRLRQIDVGGAETLSNVIALTTSISDNLTVNPSATNSVLTINAKYSVPLKIISCINGEIVLEGQTNSQFDVSFLTNGIYFIITANQSVKFLKF